MKIYLQSHTDEGFKFEDEYVETRGKYKLNQTLDYDSLQYSPSLDYPIEIEGETIYPGGSYEKYLERQNGKYARADWAWRWSKELFNYGYENGFIVVKKYEGYSRIYTKTYQNVTIEKGNNGFTIKEIERTKPLSSLEFTENHYSNDNAKKQLLELFEKAPFDYSKSVTLLEFLAAFSTKNDDIILDFFSGSSTTAHSIMKLNAEDGGNRRFIMVQLPEICDEKSEAYKAGYSNICEVGKERIRRAGKKILEQNAQTKLGDEEKSPLDVGFKVFKLDTSNLKTWDGTPIQDKQIDLFYERLNAMIDTVKDDRTDMDVVYEVMLKMGIPLDVEVQYMEINDKIAYIVGDFILMICLADKITAEDIEAMAQYAPAKIICAEAGFADDSALSNAHYILKDRAIELKLV